MENIYREFGRRGNIVQLYSESGRQMTGHDVSTHLSAKYSREPQGCARKEKRLKQLAKEIKKIFIERRTVVLTIKIQI